ncbi:chromosome partitioning protein ParB [Arthrobacter sp. MYb23]|uniref:ParB/RepB/Spo0J family partition protein n=1 Tax=unclassified Arthrobacter TaxID=235627 RepID=UPI000CFC55A0|nr:MULTISPECIES: ParB/RepB/Spo0J family partition protein [unclassified Arthrobacter]PRB43837.1 chromosome partitioning protein ParB [Arthrobacter sp. MYb51]PRB97443.1 chromosome partitioning protein ParB [Arthrobacter sp. MYb23]
MSEKRRGLGRGLGALIPSSASAQGNGAAPSRPVDLFFPEARKTAETTVETLLDESNAADSKPAAEEPSAASQAGGARAAKSASKSAASKSSPAKTAAPSKTAAKASDSRSAATKTAVNEAGSTASAAPSVPATQSAPEVELVEVPGARFAEIPVGDIHPNRKQPRSVFDEDDMAELVHSVREIGVLQPIVVRTSTEKGGEPYELVMGERRWRAVQAAGLETIPAIVRDTTDDDLLRDALLENLHRSQLNPLEEAAAYQQLLEDFGTTHEQLADRIGRSRPQVSNTLRLLKLPPLVQRRVAAGVLSAGHARALLALPDAAAMERMAQKIVAEGMSVRATEESVALYQDPTTPAKSSIPKPNARHERLDYLASSLSDRLDTNVKITLGARKGRVSIEFASVEDLNRIMDVLGPGAED